MSPQFLHPHHEVLSEQYRQGKISRREFMRLSALVGISLGAASLALPRDISWAQASMPQRGGMLKVASIIHKLSNPAQISWGKTANILRQVAEYLTVTGPDNITRPFLASDWQASKNLKTWTFNLRRGIRFNNGDEFTADDVLFTLNLWLGKEVKSSMLGLVGSYLSPGGIEKTGPYQFVLHLNRPEIGLPEHFFHYPAFILNHRTFEGDFLKAPHGTGPYTLETYSESEIAVLKARSDYWQMGTDGKPLPYLEGMTFLEICSESAPQLAALQSGEVDMIDLSDSGRPNVMLAARKDPKLAVRSVTTSQVRVLRMRTDKAPWSDNRVRLALKFCQRREKILKLAYFNEGMQGQDFHVYPGHPEYCPQPTPKYDPDKAKALLKEANGILDIEERRKIFCRLEAIQQERGSVCIAFWQNLWMVTTTKLKGVSAHPNLYMLFNQAYFED